MTPPSIGEPSLSELWNLAGVGRKFKGLPRKDAFRLLRWGPMAVADLVAEFFETELLRAIVAARGIYGTFAGPWSAGTCLNVIMQAASDANPAGPRDLRARRHGRADTGARLGRARIRRRGPHRRDRRPRRRRRTARPPASSSRRAKKCSRAPSSPTPTPSARFLGLVDPVDLDPDFLHKIGNYRSMGTIAKVHLALNGLPEFPALKGAGAAASGSLSGRIHVGPEIDYLERAYDAAKYGDFSPHPYCDVTIPTVTDPSLAPSGKHVMSVVAQFAPYKLKGDWNAKRDALGDAVVDAIAAYAPDLKAQIAHRQVLTPLDLEQTYGLTGGHVLHGEPALDQLFTMRPLLDWAQYRTPVRGLYLCGSGTHPGGGVTGANGANASREVQKDLRSR